MSTLATSPTTESDRQVKPLRNNDPYAGLARRLTSGLAQQTQAVGVTSCNRGEGVSTVAANLAICATHVQDGPIILVDANERRPSVAANFGLNGDLGASDFLAGDTELDACIHTTSLPNLLVMPTGLKRRRMLNAEHAKLADLFDILRQRSRLVLVDLPAVNSSGDGICLSQVLDGYLLVVESERVRLPVAERVKDQFEDARANLLGAVLNKRRHHIPNWLYRKL